MLAEAGERADRRNDMPAAVTLIRRALDLLADDTPQRAEMLAALGSALLRAGRLEESSFALEEAIETGARGGRSAERAAGDGRAPTGALVHRAGRRRRGDRPSRGRGDPGARADRGRLRARQGLAAAERRARLRVPLAGARGGARARDRARPPCSGGEGRGKHLRRAAGGRAPLSARRRPNEAIARCEGFLEEAGDDLALRASVSAPLGALLAMRGRFDEARAAYAESVELQRAPRAGHAPRRVLGLRRRDRAARRQRRGGGAGASLRLRAARADGRERRPCRRVGAAGRRAPGPGHSDEEAGEFARAAQALAEPEDIAAQAFQRTARASVLLRDGDLGGADRLAREAVELARADRLPRAPGGGGGGLAAGAPGSRATDGGRRCSSHRRARSTSARETSSRPAGSRGDLARPGATA